MQAVLVQEAAFFDAQPPGELASRLMSEPDRLEEIANRGIEKVRNEGGGGIGEGGEGERSECSLKEW